MALPPIHRFTHEPVLVVQDDDAWDHEKIYQEFEWIENPKSRPDEVCPWQTQHDHPWWRYFAGRSRYDLSTVQQYLLPEKNPTKFILRRLPLEEWTQMENLIDRERQGDARNWAVRHGLKAVEGAPEGFKLERNSNGSLTSAALDELRSTFGDLVYIQLGSAIVDVSRNLTDEEKKV